jgi:hypothetical protein
MIDKPEPFDRCVFCREPADAQGWAADGSEIWVCAQCTLEVFPELTAMAAFNCRALCTHEDLELIEEEIRGNFWKAVSGCLDAARRAASEP